MESHIGYIMTVSNSIIGVSILAMPFCFKQCGIILAVLMLLASSFISRLTCHYLLKSANMARRRTFELLAFHTFGSMGKLIVELGIIGFLMGTCIAFFVIIGDLGPTILVKILELDNTDILRTTLLVCVAAFCVLPLGLLKNVESLSSVSTATIGFYFCLVLKTIAESASHIAVGDWISKVEFWRPAGILQCFPIFAMALSCQTQLFEIYETLPNASLDKMNYVVRMAVNICVCVYICVGLFGYIAFSSYPFTGNILMSFSPSMMTDAMKIGFVLSVACSFPLVIFPCRASLYSLLFRKYNPPKYTYACKLFLRMTLTNDYDEQDEGYNPYEGMNNFIPETRFKLLTFFIVGVSLMIGIMIPNIEVVLGLVGSTIGTLICVIFPVTCFICISTKNTNERILAQIMLFIGVIMMVMGTYANLYAMEESHSEIVVQKDVVKINQDNFIKNIRDSVIENIDKPINKVPENFPPAIKIEPVKNVEIRHEPPQPEEPIDVIPKIESKEQKNNMKNDLENNLKITPEKMEVLKSNEHNELPKTEKSDLQNNVEKIELQIDKQSVKVDIPPTVAPKLELKTEPPKPVEVDKAAIEKDEKEFLEEIEDKNKNEILETLKKTKEEQHQLILEQKKVLEEIKKQKEELKEKELEGIKKENELRMKAVSQLVEFAKKTLESLGNEQNKDKKDGNTGNIEEKIKDNKNPIEKIGGDADKNKLSDENKTIDKIKKESVGNEIIKDDRKDNKEKNNVVEEKIKQEINNLNVKIESNIKNKVVGEGNRVIMEDKKNSKVDKEKVDSEKYSKNEVNNNNVLKEVNDIKLSKPNKVQNNENVELDEQKLKKLNSTIENMLPFPLQMLKVTKKIAPKMDDTKGLNKVNENIEKKEIKLESNVENVSVENQVEPKLDDSLIDIKQIKPEEKKKEDVKSDNKVGRDLLADDPKEMLRKKREILNENDNCESKDKSSKIIVKYENIPENLDIPSKISNNLENSQNVLNKPKETIGNTRYSRKGFSDNTLPNNLPENTLPNKLETSNQVVSSDLPKTQQKTTEETIRNKFFQNSLKQNILPKQIDVLNSLKENFVDNLKFSQDILKTNFILHKRRK